MSYASYMPAIVSLKGRNVEKANFKAPCISLTAQTNSYTKTLALSSQMN